MFYHCYEAKLPLQNSSHNQNPETIEFWKPQGNQTTMIRENIILPNSNRGNHYVVYLCSLIINIDPSEILNCKLFI